MKFEKYFVFMFVAALVLFVVALLATYSAVKEQTIRDMNAGQMVHARQAASGINSSMNNVIGILELLARSPDMAEVTRDARRSLIDFQQLNAGEIQGVTRINSHGRIVFTHPSAASVGQDVSSQEHVQVSLATHKVVVSDVFRAVQGFRTVAVHVPVFRRGVYEGTLAALVSFDKLARRHIENIRIGDNGYAWVISAKGIILSSPETDLVGTHVRVAFKEYPGILSMADSMLKGREGITSYWYRNIRQPSSPPILKHAVFVPATLGSSFWSIVVATPEEEFTAPLAGLRTRLLLITVALFTVSVLYLYLVVRFRLVIGEQRKRDAMTTALRESESRYRVLFEQNPAPMLIYERGSLRLLSVNEAFRRHYGYSSEDVSTMALTDLYPDEEKSRITKIATGLQGYQDAGEWNHRKRDGSMISIVARSNDLVYEGHEARVAVFTDVTERKKVEEQIKNMNRELERHVAERTARLEMANKDLESFSYSVSHDLRAPLRAIGGFAEIIARRYRSSLSQEAGHYFDNIVQASERMGHLIDDLLRYSRLGRHSVHIVPVCLKDVLDHTAKQFAQQLKETNGTLEIQKDGPLVMGDISLLHQILSNLIQNALIYFRPGEAPHVTVTWLTDESHVTLSVADSGIGIASEYFEKIFHMFQRLHSDDEYPGTGIGLSTVKKATEMLGGSVWVASEKGRGSTFSVRLAKG